MSMSDTQKLSNFIQPLQQPQYQPQYQQQPQPQYQQQPQPQYQQQPQPQPQYQQQPQPQPQYQQQPPPQYQQQTPAYSKPPQSQTSASSGSWFQPCGDGSIIPFGTGPPQLTIILRMLVRNCLWIVIFLILLLLFVKYLIHPCYGECRSFFLIESVVHPIPLIGPIAARVICFFACLFINIIKFFFNGLTKFLGI